MDSEGASHPDISARSLAPEQRNAHMVAHKDALAEVQAREEKEKTQEEPTDPENRTFNFRCYCTSKFPRFMLNQKRIGSSIVVHVC